ncbi:MAG TPA: hypothetical protein ENJ09_01265, partial [Planctomycetes bacterium]|nr:hypothetical protein [Planctomycetota bacterium]
MIFLLLILQALSQGPASPSTPDSSARKTPGRMAFGDLDGDGRPDLYLAHRAGGRLFLRSPDRSLVPVPPDVVPLVPGRSAQWKDVDDDGDLDLLVWGEGSIHLLLNEMAVLHDATMEAGLVVPETESVESIDWIDLDGDDVEDVLLSVERGFLAFRNLGQARFEGFDLGPGNHLAERPAVVPTAPTFEDDADTIPLPETGAGTGKAHGERPRGNRDAPGNGRRVALAPLGAPSPASLTATEDLQFGGSCAARIRDAVTGACLQASTVPTLGMLMPLSSDFFVNATGSVGIGTTFPTERLTVGGNILAQGQLRSTILSQPPLLVGSKLRVPNLNADMVDGLHADSFTQLGQSIDSSEIVDGSIVDADISSSALIDGKKVDPDFGARDVITSGQLMVGTNVPLGRARVSDAKLGLNASHLGSEDLVVESSDAFLGLVSDEVGTFG